MVYNIQDATFDKMTSVFSLQLEDKTNNAYYQQLIAHADEDIRTRVAGLRQKEDAYRSLFANFLVKHIVAQHTGMPFIDIRFNYGPHGKPYLQGLDDFHFNIAHSGKWIVCAISDHTVGVDIEQEQPIALADIVEYFSTAEQVTLLNLPYHRQESYIYELWTLKESFLKQSGAGLSRPLNTFTVRKDDDHFVVIDDQNNRYPLFFRQYNIPGYKMAVCAPVNEFSDMGQLTLSQILSHYF